jgi:hypothetical protein
MRWFLKLVCLTLGFQASVAYSYVGSSTGNIYFSPNETDTVMALNSNGLGIGTLTPSANLHVQGNAIVSQSLSVGHSSSSSSNLSLQGTIGYSMQTVTSNAIIHSSIVMADSSSSNLHLVLPDSTSSNGMVVHVKKTSTNNKVTISGPFEGHPYLLMSSGNMGYLSTIAGQGNWHILSNSESQGQYFSTTNLQLWLDASQSGSIQYGSSGNVEVWRDLSPHQRHFSQTDALRQPTWHKQGMNQNYAGLVFSGSQYLEHASTSAFNFMHSGNGMTLFVVASYSDDTDSRVVFDNGGSSTSRVGSIVRFHQFDISTKLTIGSANLNLVSHLTSGNKAPKDTAYVHRFSHRYLLSGADYHQQVNRNATVSGNSSMAPSSSSAKNNMRIGMNHFSADPMIGTISEIMVFDKVLSDAEIQRIHELLMTKYGI